jgi:hypothetical protein
MLAFNVSLNGKKLCLAGLGKRGVLSAIVNWVAGEHGADLFLDVGGLAKEEHVGWVRQKPLQVGDEILVRIVDVGSPDKPRRKPSCLLKCSAFRVSTAATPHCTQNALDANLGAGRERHRPVATFEQARCFGYNLGQCRPTNREEQRSPENSGAASRNSPRKAAAAPRRSVCKELVDPPEEHKPHSPLHGVRLCNNPNLFGIWEV